MIFGVCYVLFGSVSNYNVCDRRRGVRDVIRKTCMRMHKKGSTRLYAAHALPDMSTLQSEPQ